MTKQVRVQEEGKADGGPSPYAASAPSSPSRISVPSHRTAERPTPKLKSPTIAQRERVRNDAVSRWTNVGGLGTGSIGGGTGNNVEANLKKQQALLAAAKARQEQQRQQELQKKQEKEELQKQQELEKKKAAAATKLVAAKAKKEDEGEAAPLNSGGTANKKSGDARVLNDEKTGAAGSGDGAGAGAPAKRAGADGATGAVAKPAPAESDSLGPVALQAEEEDPDELSGLKHEQNQNPSRARRTSFKSIGLPKVGTKSVGSSLKEVGSKSIGSSLPNPPSPQSSSRKLKGNSSLPSKSLKGMGSKLAANDNGGDVKKAHKRRHLATKTAGAKKNAAAAAKAKMGASSSIKKKRKAGLSSGAEAATAGGMKKQKRDPPNEVFSGKPDEPLEGGWPQGWTKKVYERRGGATKGRPDRYWFTPIEKYKLRSMAEVKRFLKALKECGGDEVAAKKKAGES